MGSYIHARSLFDKKVNVTGMICLEMIGFFSDEPGSQQFPSDELAGQYPDTGNFIIVIGLERCAEFNRAVHEWMAMEESIRVERIDFPDANRLAGLSDQRNYWKFGYDAVMINDTSFLRNPNYHSVTDTIETLDFQRMAGVVNGCYRAMVNLD